MVVRITSPHSLQRALNYNEQKCRHEKAVCIFAGNYLLEPGQMNFHQKKERMQELISRNERTKKTNTLHISLNFDPSEKLCTEKLTCIAQQYMEKIGFGNQPYLVYRHNDAGHPHLHIVTTTICADGKRINTYNIGRNQSEKARKEIECMFCLVKAQVKRQVLDSPLSPVQLQKVQYGKSETRRSIANVLDQVINQFKYTSLAELNAILQLYNVSADRGMEGSQVNKYGGLFYRLLDSKGNKCGVPVKASLFHNKPTLKYLEIKFKENEQRRHPDIRKLKTVIDWALSGSPPSLKEFIAALNKEKIFVVLRENKTGVLYGITFVDFRTKAVFNGSDLGKQYSIAGIQKYWNEKTEAQLITKKPAAIPHSKPKEKLFTEPREHPDTHYNERKGDVLKDLMEAERGLNRVSGDLLKKKRKKRNQTR